MSWTLTTSGAAIVKAGTHANSTIIASGTALVKMSDDVEGLIEVETKRSWVSNYASLSTGVKGILSDIASSMIAMQIVSYDNTGYLTREADMIMNFNDDKISTGMALLKDFKTTSLQTP